MEVIGSVLVPSTHFRVDGWVAELLQLRAESFGVNLRNALIMDKNQDIA
jgi:hypothetical protein